MIGYKVTCRSDVAKVIRRINRDNPKRIEHGAAMIRLIARRSIRTSKRPAKRGKPPHTRGRRRLRKAILYAVYRSQERALIGPSYQIVGIAGAEHEHGWDVRKEMEPRPLMGPALEEAAPRLPDQWAGFLR